MSLESEVLLDAKLIMRDGLVRSRPGTNVDARGYVDDWRSNLIAGISPDLIEGDFRRGQGSELDSKFQAAHSSAALVVNTFGPFRNGRDAFTVPELGSLILRQFERTFPTGVPKGIPPHLDAEAIGPEGIVAIESKCLEYFAPKAAKFAPAYQFLTECQKAPWFAEMERLRDCPTHYRRLDAAQLIKHAFGLIHSAPGGAALLYLFWEPEDAKRHHLFAEHRREIAQFAGRVAGGGPSFKAMSYPELWADWARSDTPKLRDHAEQLFARYGGSLGSYEGYSRIDGRKSDAGMFDDDDLR